MSETVRDSGRRWAVTLAGLATAEVLAAIVGVLATGLPFAVARDSFLISNATIGAASAISGGLIAWHRPRNAVGWFLLGSAVAQSATAAITPWLARDLMSGAGNRDVLASIYNGAWPWAVALFLPLTLWCFPDGRLLGRRWRWGVGVIVINAVLQILLFSADDYPLATVAGFGPGTVPPATSWLALPSLAASPLWVLSDLLLAATFLVGAASLIIRYRRGDERTRLQLLWPLLATVLAGVVIAGTRLPGPFEETGVPVLATVLVAGFPVAVAVAVLRHRLLDIRMVWSRTLTYLLLTAGAVGIYVTLVELGARIVRVDGLVPSVVATLLVAIGFDPVRVRLRQAVDRLVYGERQDPVRAASSVTRTLAAEADQPRDILPALCAALRLPWAALVVDGEVVGEHGRRPERIELIPLRHAGETVGDLQIGVRAGQRQLDPVDRAVLELMAVPIGVALRAEALSAAMRRSRQEIVAAREEERRRIRRDLHDGLASVLTGVAFQADTVVAIEGRDPARTTALVEEIRAGVTGAIGDVRRLINELHPAVLDDHGLVEAVRRHARRLAGPELAITVTGDVLDGLPAAVEVAAYRILVEALTNVARHSGATAAEVLINRSGDALVLQVRDNGPCATAWTPGVGLQSMQERAEELSGEIQATPSPDGGQVEARLPLNAAVAAR